MESHPDRTDAAEAAAALDLVDASRTQIADRLITPWWYHPALGSVFGAFFMIHAVDSRGLRYVLILAWAVVGVAVVDAYRRRTGLSRAGTGLWVNGFPTGRARREATALVTVLVALGLAAVVLDGAAGWVAAPVVAGVLAVPCVIVLGRRLDRALREDLRTGSRTRADTGDGVQP